MSTPTNYEIAYTARTDFLQDPPLTSSATRTGTTLTRYSDVYSNVAPYLLEDGHSPLGCHTFTPIVDEQCRDFLRTCNTRFHGQIEGPESSGFENMHEKLVVHNLYVQLKHALDNRAKLNLYQYNVIGSSYTRVVSSTRASNSTQCAAKKTPRRYFTRLVTVLFLSQTNKYTCSSC